MGIQPKRNSGQQSETAFRNFGGRPTVATTLAVRGPVCFNTAGKGRGQPATQRCQQPAGSITTTLGVRPAVTPRSTRRPLLDKLGVSKARSSDNELHRVSTYRGSVRQQRQQHQQQYQQQQPGGSACFSTAGVSSRDSLSPGVSLGGDTAQREHDDDQHRQHWLWNSTALLESRISETLHTGHAVTTVALSAQQGDSSISKPESRPSDEQRQAARRRSAISVRCRGLESRAAEHSTTRIPRQQDTAYRPALYGSARSTPSRAVDSTTT